MFSGEAFFFLAWVLFNSELQPRKWASTLSAQIWPKLLLASGLPVNFQLARMVSRAPFGRGCPRATPTSGLWAAALSGTDGGVCFLVGVVCVGVPC